MFLLKSGHDVPDKMNEDRKAFSGRTYVYRLGFRLCLLLTVSLLSELITFITGLAVVSLIIF